MRQLEIWHGVVLPAGGVLGLERARMSDTTPPTPYELVGCAVDASDKDVRKAYRKMALRVHPDKNPGDPRAGPPPAAPKPQSLHPGSPSVASAPLCVHCARHCR